MGQPVRIIHHSQIYPGYDNLSYRRPALGKWIRRLTYAGKFATDDLWD